MSSFIERVTFNYITLGISAVCEVSETDSVFYSKTLLGTIMLQSVGQIKKVVPNVSVAEPVCYNKTPIGTVHYTVNA